MKSSDYLPFYSDPWRGERAEAARAIWDWHLAIRELAAGGQAGEMDFGREAQRIREGAAAELVNPSLAQRVHEAIGRFDLGVEEFASQVEVAAALRGPIRFVDARDQRAFFDKWTGSLGRLLASLAGVSGVLHVGYVNALSSGFYLLDRVLEMPTDVPAGRVFIPQDELAAFSVSEAQLAEGPPDAQVTRLLWKQCVRIRDYFARALPLSRDLPRRYSVGFRRWWLGGLEMVNAIERRKYDVWSAPITLSAYHRAQARFQARFARASFKRR